MKQSLAFEHTTSGAEEHPLLEDITKQNSEGCEERLVCVCAWERAIKYSHKMCVKVFNKPASNLKSMINVVTIYCSAQRKNRQFRCCWILEKQ
jgi:hypothetical protein